ncbi:MAG: hypothetical protein H7X94_11440, partial [Vallitaleaceae bacterium]|nr:hypothetical protein [Vallitaleaceae bacterium]
GAYKLQANDFSVEEQEAIVQQIEKVKPIKMDSDSAHDVNLVNTEIESNQGTEKDTEKDTVTPATNQMKEGSRFKPNELVAGFVVGFVFLTVFLVVLWCKKRHR